MTLVEEPAAPATIDPGEVAAGLEAALEAALSEDGARTGRGEDGDAPAAAGRGSAPDDRGPAGLPDGPAGTDEDGQPWTPFQRGRYDVPDESRAGAPPRPKFRASELQLMESDPGKLGSKVRRRRKALLNRFYRREQSWQSEVKAREEEAARNALRARAAELAPERGAAEAAALDGSEFLLLWNAAMDLGAATGVLPAMSIDIPREGREPLRASTIWTDEERRQLAPHVLRLYARYPSLAEWARLAGGPEVALLLIGAPLVAAKCALIYASIRQRWGRPDASARAARDASAGGDAA